MNTRGVLLAAMLAALLGSAVPAVAGATPTVTFKAKPAGIKKFKGTGNHLGAGAEIKLEYGISGTEYVGWPQPLVGLNLYLPAGAEVHPAKFVTCAKAVLEGYEPERCPSGSAGGPTGSTGEEVAFGSEQVPEDAQVLSFLTPSNGLSLYLSGHSPETLEAPAFGSWTSLKGSGGQGPELSVPIPIVLTIPGALNMRTTKLDVALGTAFKEGETARYYLTLPKECPASGRFAYKTELTFEEYEGAPRQTVTKEYEGKCPKG